MSCWHSFTLIVLNVTLLYSSMAESLHPPPVNCSTCGRSVRYQRVKSNKNGNQGQLLAKVSSASTLIFIHFLKTLQCVSRNQVTDEQCNFWHWCPDPRYALPPPSPLPGSDDLEPISSPPMGLQGIVLAATAPVGKAVCSAPGCKSTRLRRDCTRFHCKTHCMELGEGCRSPAHKVAGVTLSSCPTPLPPTTSLPIVIDPALASSASVQPLIISAHPLNQQPIASSSSSGPRHASHMAPIFTEQWATEQRLLEEKRTSDALRLMHTEKAKQTIFIYVWTQVCYVSINICAFLMSIAQDDSDPTVVEFQDGFIWPYFKIDAPVLERLGLGSLPPTVSLNLYRPHMRLWTGILVNHIIHLTINNTCIFLKPSNVQSCKDLQVHTSGMPFISRIDVTAERAHMKSWMELQCLEHAYASLAATPNSKRGLSPTWSALASPPLKRCAAGHIPFVPIVQPRSAAATRVKWHKKANIMNLPVESDLDDNTDEPDLFSSPLQRHSGTPLFSPLIQPSMATLPQPSATPLQALLAPLPTPIIQTEPLDDIPIHFGRTKAIWPGQRSVNDIVRGFTSVDKLSCQQGYTVSKAFEEVFDVKFPGTTFYKHRCRWNSASQEDRNMAQTSNQSWISFAETHPTSHAAAKAARKRQQRMLC